MTSLKGSNYAFRDQVVLAFVEAGFSSARRPKEVSKLDPAAPLKGDVLGLPCTVAVRNHVTVDLPGAMREVRAEAADEGNEIYASVQKYRGADDVLSSFVTTDLACFIRLLGRLHPEALA